MSIKRGNIVVQELNVPFAPGTTIVDDFVKPRIPDLIRTTAGNGWTEPPKRKSTVAFDETPQVTTAKIAFLESLTKLEEKQRKQSGDVVKVDVTLDPNKTHDWNEVIQALQTAEKQYLNVKDQGPLGKIQDCLRKCEAARGGVESWLRLLPAESWQGSLLCGGLKIIVGVAADIGDIRDLVTETIEQIPLSIETALELYKLYPDNVRTHVGNVLAATFEVMRECIEFFLRNPMKKVMSATFRGKDYGKDFKVKLAAMKRLQEQMKAKASLAKQHADHDCVLPTPALFRTVCADQNVARELLRDVDRKMDVVVGNEKDQRQQVQQLTDSISALLSDNKKRNDIENQLRTEAQALKWRNRVLQSQMSQIKAQRLRDGLFQILAYEEHVNLYDLHSSLRIGNTLSSEAQGCASTILYSAQVQTWLGDENSNVLVVNAMDQTGLMTHSTASYFSALLLVSLNKIAPTDMTISWFCGQHVQDTDLSSMLANLLGQLLSKGLDGLGPEELRPPTESPQRDCRSLTMLFVKYLRLQLRKTPVYCIIDSISWYEDFQRLEGLFDVWTELARLVRNDEPGLHPLKVLATSPSQCTRIGTQLDYTKPSVYWARNEQPGAYGMGSFVRRGSYEVH